MSYQSEYYQKNKEKVKQRVKKYSEKNKDKIISPDPSSLFKILIKPV